MLPSRNNWLKLNNKKRRVESSRLIKKWNLLQLLNPGKFQRNEQGLK
jgi:hypothetical protein